MTKWNQRDCSKGMSLTCGNHPSSCRRRHDSPLQMQWEWGVYPADPGCLSRCPSVPSPPNDWKTQLPSTSLPQRFFFKPSLYKKCLNLSFSKYCTSIYIFSTIIIIVRDNITLAKKGKSIYIVEIVNFFSISSLIQSQFLSTFQARLCVCGVSITGMGSCYMDKLRIVI